MKLGKDKYLGITYETHREDSKAVASIFTISTDWGGVKVSFIARTNRNAKTAARIHALMLRMVEESVAFTRADKMPQVLSALGYAYKDFAYVATAPQDVYDGEDMLRIRLIEGERAYDKKLGDRGHE